MRFYFLNLTITPAAGPSGHAIWGVGLWPLACWDRGFESLRGHECLSVVSVVCCQVQVSATSWTLVQRSPTDCAASLCVWSRNLKNEEAMTRVGSQRNRIHTHTHIYIYIYIYIKSRYAHSPQPTLDRSSSVTRILKDFYWQEWQCRYNVTFRRFHAAIVAVEKQSVLHNQCVYL
jgi:hypothetical protein